MICFEPVQVSTAFSQLSETTTIKVATNLTRRVHFYWSVGDVGARVCLPALGEEGSILAGGTPYSARPARNRWDVLETEMFLTTKWWLLTPYFINTDSLSSNNACF